MKNIIYAVVGVSFVCLVAYKYFGPKEEIKLPKYSSYLSCDGYPTDMEAKLKGEIYFLKSALPENEKEKSALFRDTIIYQQFYTFTNLGKMQNLIVKSSNQGNRPQTKILSTEDAEYPFTAIFESEQEIFFFSPEKQTYLNKIFPLGKIQKGEPAVKVTYEYSNNIELCLNSADTSLLNQIEFLTPKDPLFAYFAVAPEDRRFIENKSWKTRGKINPCMDDSALGTNTVAPFALWYHWLPRFKGPDADNNPYDCEKFYNDDVVNKVAVNLKENNPKDIKYFNFKELDNLERPIEASIIFGAYDNVRFKTFEEKEVSEYINKYVSNLSPKEAREYLPWSKDKFDYSFSAMLIVLWNMTKHMDIHSMESEINSFDMTIYLRGKLKLSKKDIEIKFSVIRNKPGAEGSPVFDKKFGEAMQSDDIVVYGGHASYGGVLNGALKLVKEGSLKTNPELKYQVLALYSCNSNFYFHPDNFPKSSNEMKRDFISAGGGFNDPTSNATLALFASLDSYLYNENYVPFGLWSKQFKTDNFLILSNN